MNALLAFFLGQLSIAVLIFAFIKFFIFGEAPSSGPAIQRSSRPLLHSSLRRKKSAVLRPAPALSTETILKKTYYNVSGHQPESLDWFNVLVAQTIAQLRAEAQHENAILKILTAVLNGPQKPDFLGDIVITEVTLGEEFPIFSNCRIIPVEEGRPGTSDGQKPAPVEGTRLQARLDVDLNDVITLGVETKLVLNYPKPVSAILPVALAVSVVRFRGTLSLSFVPAPAEPSSDTPDRPSPTTLEFSFLPDYDLELSVRSLVGSRSRLQDVPKIAQLVEARLHAWFDERCVEPRVQQIVIPSLWPRKKNTRGGDDESAQELDGLDEGAVDTETDSNAATQPSVPASAPIPQISSLEARMAEEGRKLREAESRDERNNHRTQASQLSEGMRRRLQQHQRAVGSSEDLRIPGSLLSYAAQVFSSEPTLVKRCQDDN